MEGMGRDSGVQVKGGVSLVSSAYTSLGVPQCFGFACVEIREVDARPARSILGPSSDCSDYVQCCIVCRGEGRKG